MCAPAVCTPSAPCMMQSKYASVCKRNVRVGATPLAPVLLASIRETAALLSGSMWTSTLQGVRGEREGRAMRAPTKKAAASGKLAAAFIYVLSYTPR